MGHQYINIDKRTTTNVFMLQKIYKFSNIEQKYVCKMRWGGHKNKKWNDLHLLASYLTELFSEKLMVNKMKK